MFSCILNDKKKLLHINYVTLSLFIETFASAIALIENGKIAKANIMVLNTAITVNACKRMCLAK